ncbi:MAG: hypothetical protein COA71_13220 [SAR86 cluster bacterium]|uniref:GNAT family N-acetyltransferase n=1 Tax=SAR86 cluster bacterium TaxID=2030880 RepID=A0A2A5C7P7_9GAMM|nr:MAG: hypothetical protein COA71_13220 [SAR86 cluster bacterium]
MTLKLEVCTQSNVDKLISFIDKYWKKNHIFVNDRALFDWQHKNKEEYNFILAIENGDILAILGFIPTSQYSKPLQKHNEIWLAIWKVRDDVKKPGLGLLMLKFLQKHLNDPTICSLGLSQEVIPLYRALKYEVGILEHRAFFNQKKVSFDFISPPESFRVSCNRGEIKIISDASKLDLSACDFLFVSQPKKNIEYITNRYLRHPSYAYEMLFFQNNENVVSIVIYRIIVIDDVRIARIVDVIGSNILEKDFNYSISIFLEEQNIDYIDIVSNLICSNESGFISNTKDFILPNYFEPLEIKNVKVDYAYKSKSGALAIFRGDSDQDRPNI